MGLLDYFKNRISHHDSRQTDLPGYEHEFCPRCEANITLQKGYSNALPYWVCKGCGEMLINPALDGEVAWFCDRCEAMLNVQEGFSDACGSWACTECGFINRIDVSQVYVSDDEYKSDRSSPYRGLSDEAVLELSLYIEERPVNHRDDVLLVRHVDDNRLYVKKILSTYDASIYRYLQDNPVAYMPRIVCVYESSNRLIVIEEYVEGKTLLKLLEEGAIAQSQAVHIAKSICNIVKTLHTLDNPIIHRDIKPSNIIISQDEVYLLDINVAKWYDEDAIEDTRLLGTQYYAAPEQLGYGFMASSERSDIYAIGVLLNVMVTGKLPKEEKAPEPIWSIVEKCIRLNADERYADDELRSALESIVVK